MKKKISILSTQAQDFLLRLFVESYDASSSSYSCRQYTCAHCGTFMRLHA